LNPGLYVLLGAAGGSVRGLIEIYNHFTHWRAARHQFRQQQRSGAAEASAAPQLASYLDAVPETVALVIHTSLGAGAGFLFTATGQVTGAFAAIVVGASAPALLTQLGQLRAISDRVNGDRLDHGEAVAPRLSVVSPERASDAS
jgi:hypothetical protein